MDYAGPNNGNLMGGASFTSGIIGQAFQFDGTNGYVLVPDSPILRPTNLTIEAWVRFSSLTSQEYGGTTDFQVIAEKPDINSPGEGSYNDGFTLITWQVDGRDTFEFEVTASNGYEEPAAVDPTLSIQTNVWYFIAGVRGSNYIELYVNGQLADQKSVDFDQSYGAAPLYFGSLGEPEYAEGKLEGNLDEVSLYNRALSSNEVQEAYNAGLAGIRNCFVPPVIVTQPSSQLATVDGTATLLVAAAGSPPLNYQWSFNGTNIAGATNATLILPNIQSTNTGSYSAVVSNSHGTVTSSNALVIVDTCFPSVDVALVIDDACYSTNLLDDGNTEIWADRTAATNFIQGLNFTSDQAALFAFDYNVATDQTLTNSPSDMLNAIGSVPDGVPGSHPFYGNALQIAQAELAGPRHNSDALPVMVFIASEESFDIDWGYDVVDASNLVLEAATLVKASGTRLITIALGTADTNLMALMATSPNDAYYATNLFQLTNDINLIADSICRGTNSPATNMLSVQIISPVNQYLAFGSMTTIVATNTAAGSGVPLRSVQFFDGGEPIGFGVPTNNLYAAPWLPLSVSNHVLTALATDTNGLTSLSAAVTNYVVSPPTVTIVNPKNLEKFLEITNVTIAVAVTDIDESISDVQFFAITNTPSGTYTNVLLGAATATDTNGYYDFIWTNLHAGPYAVAAVATDERGLSASSGNAFSVTNANGSPFCEINYPANNAVFLDGVNITIAATAYATNRSGPVTNVEFFVNGTDIGGCAEPPYSITRCCWEPGTYQLMAIAADSLGAFGISSNVNITVLQEPETGFWDPTFITSGPEFTFDSSEPPDSLGPIAAGSDNTIYVAGGFDFYAQMFASTNLGRTWQPFLTNSVGYADPITTILADGTNLYVAPQAPIIQNGTNIDASVLVWNGSYWAIVGDPNNDPYNFFSAGDPSTFAKVNATLYAGEKGGTNGVFEFNTVSNEWIPVGNGFPSANAGVHAIAALNNVLYIGGTFTNAGGDINANYIACLINNTWTNVGFGIAPFSGLDPEGTGNPNSVYTYVTSLGACGSNLFVGGSFNVAGNAVNVNGVAIWNGKNWQSLNGGVMPSLVPNYVNGLSFGDYFPVVNSIVVHGDRVYLGGPFNSVFSGQTIIPAGGVAMATWDNAEQTWVWSGMDGGLNSGSFNSFALAPGISPTNYDLYVGGEFNFVGSGQIPDFDVARWRVGYLYPTNLPTVTITNPASGMAVTLGTNITVTAVAFSSVDISNVELYASGQQVGNPVDGSGPYNFSYDPTSAGVYQLIAVAQDNNGVVAASKPVILDVKGATNPITAANLQYNIPENSPPVNFYVLTNCLPTNGLFVSQVQESAFTGAGASLAPLAGYGTPTVGFDGEYITYTPQPGAYGSDYFYYTVTNGSGASDSASVTVNIYPVPQIVITNPVDLVESSASTSGVFTNVVSGYSFETGGTVTNVSLYINGALSGQTTNANFAFNWSTTGSGVYSLVAVATDENGITNASQPCTFVVTVFTGGGSTSTNQLVGTITNLAYTQDNLGDEVLPVITTGTFDLGGQASASPGGPSFPVAYQVILCTSDGYETPIANLTPQPDAYGFHEGGDVNGDLGLIDLSTVANGVYDLQLKVYGGGTQTNSTVRFTLNTACKVGQFTFSEQDLSLPVNGIPITVTRTYNSQNPNSADFGYGWTFAMNSMNVQLDEQRQNVTLGGPQAPYEDSNDNGNPDTLSVRTGGNWDVTLTLPNGQTVTFDFDPQYVGDPEGGPGYFQPEWSAPPWAHAMLTNLDINDVIESLPGAAGNGLFWSASDESFFNAPFQNQDFPGWKLITLPDKTEYYITRTFEDDLLYLPDPNQQLGTAQVYGPPTLTSIVERTGDQINIGPNSVSHIDPSGHTTAVVNITRDGQGRITSISDPNGGTNGLPLVQYVYDQVNGNLIRVIKLLDRNAGTYATTTYDYNNPNLPHYITSIEDPLGAPVTRNSYDSSGRLSQTEDANNNITRYIYGPIGTNFEQVVDPLGRTNTFVYDDNGNVTAQTNALGQVTLMAYDQFNDKTNEITFMNGQPYATNSSAFDPNGLLLSSTGPLGNTNGFTYNNFGEALTSTDARGDTACNSYDSDGQLTSTTNALGQPIEDSYNDGLLVASTDPIGTTTTNQYDPNGNLANTAALDYSSGGILSSNSYTYDANNNRLTSTIWRRVGGYLTPATTTYTYDAQNRVTQTVKPDGGANITVYNLAGQQQAAIDALGNMTSNTYDPDGHLVMTMYPDGTYETSAYDAAGNRTNSVDRMGRVTTYVYDALNRLTNTVYPDNATCTVIYDDLGRVAQTIDARGTVTAFGYDVAGRRLAVTNGFGTSVANTNYYSYDADGNQVTFADANGHVTTNVFDALNRQVQVMYPDGTTSEIVYDDDGRSIAEKNQDGVATLFGYDGAGRLTSVTNAVGTAQQVVTRYQYDVAGNEIAQIDALLRTNLYAYDAMGRVIGHTMPGGQNEGFVYDTDGNQIYQTNFNGVVITNVYNSMNRLIARIYPNGTSNTFTYTPTGQRATMNDASGNYVYSYDSRDRLLTNSGPAGILNYGYDANGNLTGITSSRGNGTLVTYQYDPLNRLTNVIDGRLSGSQNTTYHFDAVGNLQGVAYPNTVTNLYQYDSLNRLTNLGWRAGNSSLASFAYTLGASGNRVALSETISSTVARTYTWQYDKLYRLTNESVAGTAPTGMVSYAYDLVGNRLARQSTISELPTVNYSYGTNDWLTSDSYDTNGNTITSAGTNYQYDYENRLTNFNNGQVILVYDADGNRVKKIIGTNTTLYLVDTVNPSGYPQVLEELTVSGGVTNLSRAYTWGMSLISQRIPGCVTNFYGFDGHGSTRFLTDLAGNIASTYTYDAFGNLINQTGTVPNNFLYCCYQSDPDIGLVYDNARYLDLNTGRFWTMDGEGFGKNEDPLSLHKYLYGMDDPLNKIDLSGHDDDEVEQLATTGIIGMLQRFSFTVVSKTLTLIARNPGLLRAFLISQAFVTIQAVHEDPANAAVYWESGGFFADAEMLNGLVGDLKGAMTLYKQVDEAGRSCGIFARITRESLDSGTEVAPAISVPGADPSQDLQRGHLLGAMLGGRGDILENLTPIYEWLNNGPMKSIEYQVRAAVEAGETVEYRVTPLFEGDSKVPRWIKIEANGDKGFILAETLENKPLNAP